jgi:hypothetical protein
LLLGSTGFAATLLITACQPIPSPRDDPSSQGESNPPPENPSTPPVKNLEQIREAFLRVSRAYREELVAEADLWLAILNAEEALAKIPPTPEAVAFRNEPGGPVESRIDVAPWLLKNAVRQAVEEIEKVDQGCRAIEGVAAALGEIDRDTLRVGEAAEPGPREKYDAILREIEKALHDLQPLWALARRLPPAGPVDLLKEVLHLWKIEGNPEWELEDGRLTVHPKKEPARLTALHYFWKDFNARITFCILGGPFDLSVRAFPGQTSPFTMNIKQGIIPKPFILLVEVRGNSVKFKTEGGDLIDGFSSKGVPPGGGIAFRVLPGTTLEIQELRVEAR